VTTIGVIGAGRLGRNFSQAAIARGYDLVIASRRGPETLIGLIAELGPNARTGTVEETGQAGDFAVLAIPLTATGLVPAGPLAGRIVLTACNYIISRDGRLPQFESGTLTVPQYQQAHFATSRVVRAFNHIDAAQIVSDGTPEGTRNRRALAYAGDDPEARRLAADVYNEFGFDAIDAGGLADAWRLDEDQPAFVVRQNADQLRANLAAATPHTWDERRRAAASPPPR
jgi:8-hydroxy-5-deazaflavin:NADPH oxidoreductase